MSSVLQLEKYELRTLSVIWHDMSDPNEGVELVPAFNFKIFSHNANPRRFALTFDCSTSSRVRPKQAFDITTSIVGYFSCPDEWDEDTCALRATENGSTLLYGILRGLIASITAQFPYGTYYLPTVDMQAVIKEILESKNSTSPSPAKKPPPSKRTQKKQGAKKPQTKDTLPK